MDKREAKRAACQRAASIIQTAIDGADAEYLEDLYGESGAAKVEAALQELIAELDRRAG